MMHMFMWFGYDLGDFLFPGASVTSPWTFAITWIVLFVVAVLFEASKVYMAGVQRDAQLRLLPYRSDERRKLLCESRAHREGGVEASTSRSAGARPGRWPAFRTGLLVNAYQSLVFLSHNLVGYLLMLAVMVYNAQLLLAVVLGMMLGYFLFGTKLIRLQMQCFGKRRRVVCTPECDDTAEGTTPPLLDSSSESDYFACGTRTCVQPSYYYPAAGPDAGPGSSGAGPGAGPGGPCAYGARRCPAKVARAQKLQSAPGPSCARSDAAKLLSEDARCCETEEPKCCKSQTEAVVVVHEAAAGAAGAEGARGELAREQSPQVSCCHAKTVTSDSQEHIVK